MRIPYSAIPELSNVNSQLSNEQQVEPYSTAAALVVAAHIRSFYRLFAIIAVLLVFISVGITAIIMGYIKMHSCSVSYSLSRSLSIFGVLEIIICVIIALIVCIVIHSTGFLFVYSIGHCTYDMLLSSKYLSLCSSVFIFIFFSWDFNSNSHIHAS
jgi:hypothetical protein